MRFALGVILLFVVGSAQAALVTWTLNDVIFDGGSATGSFDYDANTDTYSNVNITTSTSFFFGSTYVESPEGGTTPISLDLGPVSDCGLVGVPKFCILQFDYAPLTNQGGIRALGGQEINIFNAEQRSIVGGTISAVPVPAAVWLFGSGLGLLGWMKRRQTA